MNKVFVLQLLSELKQAQNGGRPNRMLAGMLLGNQFEAAAQMAATTKACHKEAR